MDLRTTGHALAEARDNARPAVSHAERFAFEETFLCARCNRPLALYVQPVHLDVTIDCPRCGRSLTAMIRKAIRVHLAAPRAD